MGGKAGREGGLHEEQRLYVKRIDRCHSPLVSTHASSQLLNREYSFVVFGMVHTVSKSCRVVSGRVSADRVARHAVACRVSCCVVMLQSPQQRVCGTNALTNEWVGELLQEYEFQMTHKSRACLKVDNWGGVSGSE